MSTPSDATVGTFDLTVLTHRIRVAHREGTSTTQPPLVLLNGIGARLELLQPFVDQVDPAIPVIRFDVPGVGGSGRPRFPYRLSGLAVLAQRLVMRLGYRHADVLGISWGGGLAQQWALQSPRFCRRVVLCATATGSIMVPARLDVLSKMLTPHRYKDPAYAQKVAATLYGGALRDQPELAGRLLGGPPSTVQRWGYCCQLTSGAGWTSLPFLPLLRQRTLILTGDDDPIIPPVNARIMASLIPRATLRSYPDGHLGLVTLADVLGPEVSEFLLAD